MLDFTSRMRVIFMVNSVRYWSEYRINIVDVFWSPILPWHLICILHEMASPRPRSPFTVLMYWPGNNYRAETPLRAVNKARKFCLRAEVRQLEARNVTTSWMHIVVNSDPLSPGLGIVFRQPPSLLARYSINKLNSFETVTNFRLFLFYITWSIMVA
jgi:hypothetical protein